MKKKEIFETFIDVLNEAHDLDPKAVDALFNLQISCDENGLVNHPTIPCGHNNYGPTISVLGLLNGICKRITGETVGRSISCTGVSTLEFSKFDKDDE